jgi:hypothetical protein
LPTLEDQLRGRGYTDWAKQVLINLDASGETGHNIVDYILRNFTQIKEIDNDKTNLWWEMERGPNGPQIENTLFVPEFIYTESIR